ncbi:MAG: hypothetical protein LBS76_00805 [Mycoplasmataceae bacterium]|nr:hypothetical protein [Mycoplasmataceae bacterium]
MPNTKKATPTAKTHIVELDVGKKKLKLSAPSILMLITLAFWVVFSIATCAIVLFPYSNNVDDFGFWSTTSAIKGYQDYGFDISGLIILIFGVIGLVLQAFCWHFNKKFHPCGQVWKSTFRLIPIFIMSIWLFAFILGCTAIPNSSEGYYSTWLVDDATLTLGGQLMVALTAIFYVATAVVATLLILISRNIIKIKSKKIVADKK